MNPNPDAAFAALDMTPGTVGLSRDELIGGAEYFRMEPRTAERRYSEIAAAVSGWQTLAKEMNFRRAEIERMASCFLREQYS